MYRRIEINWDNPKPGNTIKGTVQILEGGRIELMKVVAEFGIEYEISRTDRHFRISDKYLPNLSSETRALIAIMCDSYLCGLNSQSKIYGWELDVDRKE